MIPLHSHAGRDVTQPLLNVLRELSLTEREFWLLQTVGFSAGQREIILRVAANSADPDRSFHDAVSDEWREAEQQLLERKLIQIIDADSRARVDGVFASFGTQIGPTSGLPQLGDVDFTILGAAVHQFIERNVFEWHPACGISDSRQLDGNQIEIIATTQPAAEDCSAVVIQDSKQSSGTKLIVLESSPIGAWCDRWWRRFSSGYRILLGTSQDVH